MNHFNLTFFLLLSVSILTHAQNTIIPDPNFEQRLIDMNYDTAPIDGVVPTANISGIVQLFVPNSGISDLTGIEDFAALEVLDCIGNPISSLNLNSNSALRELYTGTNAISSLTVTNCSNLEVLVCTGNQLTSLDVSNNTLLRTLACRNGQISGLDLSDNTALESLDCSQNLLTSLNLRNGNNAILTSMTANDNSLTCVEVDNAMDANAANAPYDNWIVDPSVTYFESCSCPEMDVIGNSMSIASGDDTPDSADDTDYGVVDFGLFLDHTFTIENTGAVDLNLTGTPVITVTNSTDFTVVSPPSNLIAANGGSTTFTLRYEPSMAGTINIATISIANDDCDENPYTFDVRGESQESLSVTNNNLQLDLKIVPNPAQEYFRISLGESVKIDRIEVFSIQGKRLQSIHINGNNEPLISVNHLLGLYILRIHSKNKFVTRKLVVY